MGHFICKNFLPISGLSFHFVYCLLCCVKAFECRCIPSVYLCFFSHYSGRQTKILLQFMSVSVLPMFSSRSFIVFGLTFKSLIYFELIFVFGVKEWSDFFFLFFFLHVAVQFPQNHLLKSVTFESKDFCM